MRKETVVEHLTGLTERERITTKQADACGAAKAHGSISSAHVGMRPAPGPENVFIRAVQAVKKVSEYRSGNSN